MNTDISFRRRGRLLIIATALLWGMAGVCVKSITWNSMQIVCSRSIISLAMLLAVRRSFKVRLTLNNILGALAMSITGMLYMASIKFTTAGAAIVLQYIAPILVFLFSVIFQKRKARLAEILITLAVFGGIVMSFAESFVSDNPNPNALLGNFLGLASGFTYAAQIIFMNSKDTDSDDSLIISCAISFLIGLPFMFIGGTPSFDLKNVVWVLILGVFQYGLANVLFGKSVQLVDRIECSLLLTIEPIFAPIPVAIIVHEVMSPLSIAGSIVVVAFVTLYGLLPSISKKYSHNNG